MVCFDSWVGLEGFLPKAVDQRLPKASAEGFGAVEVWNVRKYPEKYKWTRET